VLKQWRAGSYWKNDILTLNQLLPIVKSLEARLFIIDHTRPHNWIPAWKMFDLYLRRKGGRKQCWGSSSSRHLSSALHTPL